MMITVVTIITRERGVIYKYLIIITIILIELEDLCFGNPLVEDGMTSNVEWDWIVGVASLISTIYEWDINLCTFTISYLN